jgi:hypothetical protein
MSLSCRPDTLRTEPPCRLSPKIADSLAERFLEKSE